MQTIEKLRYKLLSLDVWGGEEGEFDINNWFYLDTLEVDEMTQDSEIINELIDLGFLKDSACKLVEIVDMGEVLRIIESKTGFPLYDLTLEH